jgi:hypothetical protein
MSTRKTPGGKDGRCVRVTTYHLHSAESRERPVAGKLYLYLHFNPTYKKLLLFLCLSVRVDVS